MTLHRLASPLLRLIACTSLACAAVAALWSSQVMGTAIGPTTLWPLAMTFAALLADRRLCATPRPTGRRSTRRRLA